MVRGWPRKWLPPVLATQAVVRIQCVVAAHAGDEHLESAGTSEDPDARLFDYDCTRPAKGPQLLPWAEWLSALEDTDRAGGVLERSAPALAALGSAEARARAAAECPVGLLAADAIAALVCYERNGPAGASDNCYHAYDGRVREGLGRFRLRVLMGTRWPILGLLESAIWRDHRVPAGPDGQRMPLAGILARQAGLDCGGIAEPIMDWKRLMHVFERQDWYQPAVDAAYGPELERGWREAAAECPLGFSVANLIKSMLCAHTESICFSAHETMIFAVLADTPLHLVAGSGWPIFWLLAHVAHVVRRHGFHLDFSPRELLAALPGPKGMETEAMRDLLAALPALQAAAIAEPQGAAEAPEPALRLVYATAAHGPRFSPYVGRFIQRARALGLAGALVVFCLDAEALAECRAAEGHCVRGSPSIVSKFALPLVLLRLGLDAMWLDMDVFLFRAPTPTVARQQRAGGFELLVSGAFALDCVCTGIIFYRAAPRTVAFLERLLVWMYEHPYEHDQKAFSAFLRAGERIAFDGDLPVSPQEMPRWAFLDPATEFVSARHVDSTGWTGDPDDIIAFHLLHGDSDDAAASRQFAARFELGVGYTPLLDLFFNQSNSELYSTPVLPHQASPELRAALYRSHRPNPRPISPGRCIETVPMNF